MNNQKEVIKQYNYDHQLSKEMDIHQLVRPSWLNRPELEEQKLDKKINQYENLYNFIDFVHVTEKKITSNSPINLNPPVEDFNAFLEKYSGGYTYGTNQGVMNSLVHLEYVGPKSGELRVITPWQYSDVINLFTANNLPIPQMTMKYSEEFLRLQGKLMSMGYSKEDAELILNMMDSEGICSNADLCNAIFYEFSNSPEEFKKIFGYPMFITNKDGNKMLNSAELLLDLYIYVNDTANGGSMLTNGKINKDNLNDKIDINGNQLFDVNEVSLNGWNADGTFWGLDITIDSFLKSKHPLLQYSTNIYPKGKVSLNIVESAINDNGYMTSVAYWDNGNPDDVVRMISLEPERYPDTDTSNWNGNGHIVSISDVTEEGFIVASWGQKYLIPVEDLEITGNCNIIFQNININNK